MAKKLMSVTIAVGLAANMPVPIASAQSTAAHIYPVKAYLCDSADHAIQFADVIAQGDGDEIARDRVGRSARAEVCGRYVGRAVIESETVRLKGGVAYKLTAYRFQEDKKLAWLAETTFAPPAASWTL